MWYSFHRSGKQNQFLIIFAVIVSSQIDTKDILFICGGAFIDLEKTISERLANIEINLCGISCVTSFFS